MQISSIFTKAFSFSLLILIASCSTKKELRLRGLGGEHATNNVVYATTDPAVQPVGKVNLFKNEIDETPAIICRDQNHLSKKEQPVFIANQNIAPETPQANKVTGIKKLNPFRAVKSKFAGWLINRLGDRQLVAALIAVLLPFVGVAVYENAITSHFWIALLFTLLFYLPGLIYALIIILG